MNPNLIRKTWPRLVFIALVTSPPPSLIISTEGKKQKLFSQGEHWIYGARLFQRFPCQNRVFYDPVGKKKIGCSVYINVVVKVAVIIHRLWFPLLPPPKLPISSLGLFLEEYTHPAEIRSFIV